MSWARGACTLVKLIVGRAVRPVDAHAEAAVGQDAAHLLLHHYEVGELAPAFGLKVGAVSGIVETDSGLHIILRIQ